MLKANPSSFKSHKSFNNHPNICYRCKSFKILLIDTPTHPPPHTLKIDVRRSTSLLTVLAEFKTRSIFKILFKWFSPGVSPPLLRIMKMCSDLNLMSLNESYTTFSAPQKMYFANIKSMEVYIYANIKIMEVYICKDRDRPP